MRLKMTADQHEALFNLYRFDVMEEKPTDDAEQLIYDFMADVYEKLRKKQRTKLVSDWSLTLTPKETLAYKIYWQVKELDADLIYERVLIDRHIAAIDQQNHYMSREGRDTPANKLLSNNKLLNAKN